MLLTCYPLSSRGIFLVCATTEQVHLLTGIAMCPEVPYLTNGQIVAIAVSGGGGLILRFKLKHLNFIVQWRNF